MDQNSNQTNSPIFLPTASGPTSVTMTGATQPVLNATSVQQVNPVAVEPAPVASPVAAPTEEGSYQPLKPGAMNFDMRHEFSKQSPFNPDLPTVIYPAAARKGTLEAIKNAPNLSTAGSAQLNQYATLIREGMTASPYGTDQDELRGRPEAMFMQEVEVNGQTLGGYVPKFKLREGAKYTGDAARNMIRATQNLGTVFSIPLWHSGFWITVRTPSEAQLLDLHRQLTQDKTLLGRATYGLLFSHTTSYTAKALMDFVIDHLHSTSLKLDENDNIMNYIKVSDYQVLLWGITCATWPNGYQYQRACISDVEKCQYTVTERVNLSRLLWVDTTSLTEKQKLHMTHRQKQTVTLEQVKAYTDEFLRGRPAQVAITPTLSMLLKMPTMVEYIDAGFAWVSMLEEDYGRALGMREEDRNTYLYNHAQAQAMVQYSHFVQAIYSDGNEVDDAETIPQSLGDLSSDDTIRNEFLKKVTEFQNESLIAFVGIPNYKCPACGEMQNPTAIPGQKHELIVLDVAQTFFPLLMQKLATIKAR